MINRSCFGGEEEDVRDTFCKTRLAQFIAVLLVIAFILTIYFTTDCYIYNPSRNCAQTTALTVLFGILVVGLFAILIRWKWYFKPTTQEEEPRSYGEITPKKITIGKHESQRVAFNPMIQYEPPKKEDIIIDMTNITPFSAKLETANTLLSNPMLETERSRSSSKDSSSSKKMSKTSKKSSKHLSSPKSPSSSARSPKLPSDSEFTVKNPMDAV